MLTKKILIEINCGKNACGPVRSCFIGVRTCAVREPEVHLPARHFSLHIAQISESNPIFTLFFQA
jgi:hypothetical protein